MYVAPSDRHLSVRDGRLHLSRVAKENWARPAIDLLFRSAAIECGARVIGVILSGMLDDGASGLRAVKTCGGIAVVQAPYDAQYPDMCRNAMEATDVDHVVAAGDLPGLLQQLVKQRAKTIPNALAKVVALEHELADPGAPHLEILPQIASPSTYACPECEGVLWRLHDDKPVRFRCHTGHAYSVATLRELQARTLEESLRTALRHVQENELMLASDDGHTDRNGERLRLQRIGQALRAALGESASPDEAPLPDD